LHAIAERRVTQLGISSGYTNPPVIYLRITMKLTENNLHYVLSRGQSELQRWLAFASDHRNECGKGDLAYQVFEVMLKAVWEEPFPGACHDTSAVMYVMLTELGQSAELCIGQVKTPSGRYLDHSWIEVDRKVIDAAISLPQIGGVLCSSPIFASIDLGSNDQMEHDYAFDDGKGFTDNALATYGVSLDEFTRLPGGSEHLWQIAANLMNEIGTAVDPADLAIKYGGNMRSVRIRMPKGR